MKNRVIDIIKKMVDSTDLEKILNEFQLTPTRAMILLKTSEGRRQLKARRQLARIHGELVAHRFGPYAIQKLTELLGDEKPELRLKSALSMLAVTGLVHKARRKKAAAADGKDAENDEKISMTSEQACEYLEAVCEVLDRRTKAAKAGNPEKICYSKAVK